MWSDFQQLDTCQKCHPCDRPYSAEPPSQCQLLSDDGQRRIAPVIETVKQTNNNNIDGVGPKRLAKKENMAGLE